MQRFTLGHKSFGAGALGKIRTCDTRFRKPVQGFLLGLVNAR